MATDAPTRSFRARLALPPVLGAAATRAAEAATGRDPVELMEQAGSAAAQAIRAVFSPALATVVCGTGGNGGDGYVVARHLADAGLAVTVAAVGEPRHAAARAMRARWHGPVVPLADAEASAVLVDAAVGSGRDRPLDPAVLAALVRLGDGARVAALDLPSGLDADTGQGDCRAADLTVAFGARKPAHLLAADRCGRVVVARLGFDLTGTTLFATAGPPPLTPAATANKYSRGALAVLGGAPGAGGAARLAAHAAARAGAGLVRIAVPAAALAENAARLDAVMVGVADDGAGLAHLLAAQRFAAIVAGPGLAAGDPRWGAVLACGLPAVLDAGVFAAFAGAPERLAAALTAPAVLTPHDGEFARLFGHAPGTDRLAAAREAAARLGAVVLLKGSATVIAAPDGRAAIDPVAPAWLATAGSGDVLSGIISALLAQGFAPFDAAVAGTWLHSAAARDAGPALTADDLPAAVGRVVAAR